MLFLAEKKQWSLLHDNVAAVQCPTLVSHFIAIIIFIFMRNLSKYCQFSIHMKSYVNIRFVYYDQFISVCHISGDGRYAR